MARALLGTWLLAGLMLASAGTVMAEADVMLNPALDGTMVIVGHGWRPGQRLVVSVGTDVYPAFADSAGGFEVPTGLTASTTTSPPVSVRRFDTSALAFARLSPAPEDDVPHPLAVLFARSLAMGAALLALGAGGLGLLSVAVRVSARPRGWR